MFFYLGAMVSEDLEAINSKSVALLLIYKGTCPRSYILELKRQYTFHSQCRLQIWLLYICSGDWQYVRSIYSVTLKRAVVAMDRLTVGVSYTFNSKGRICREDRD